MAKFVNKSGGTLILPDLKTEVRDGHSVDLSKDALTTPGVAGWVESGMLVPDTKAKASKAKE